MNWLNSLIDTSRTTTAAGFVKHEASQQVRLLPGKHYLRIRAKVMRIEDTKKFGADFSPLLVFELRGAFKEGPDPYVRILGRVQENVHGDQPVMVEVRDSVLINFIPFTGSHLEATVILYRIKTADLARRLLESFDRVTESLGAAIMGPYLKVGRAISDELTTLLHGDALQPVVAIQQGFRENEFHSGFAIYANTTCKNLKQFLDSHPENGNGDTLIHQAFIDSTPPWDYCVLELEAHENRNDIQDLDIHGRWERDVVDLIWNGEIKRARDQMKSILREIRLSPQLTDKDRRALPLAYRIEFDKEIDAWREVAGPNLTAHRAGEAKLIKPATTLKMLATRNNIDASAFDAINKQMRDYPSEIRTQNGRRPNITAKVNFIHDVVKDSADPVPMDALYETLEASLD